MKSPLHDSASSCPSEEDGGEVGGVFDEDGAGCAEVGKKSKELSLLAMLPLYCYNDFREKTSFCRNRPVLSCPHGLSCPEREKETEYPGPGKDFRVHLYREAKPKEVKITHIPYTFQRERPEILER